MQSKATTVAKYLAELPADRRAAIAAIRKVILDNLDPDYEEGMQYGMMSYYVPHRIFPPGYHCDPKQPLPFACLASQKNYISIYMMCLYGDPKEEAAFRKAWEATGRKLDKGVSCIRFKKLEDCALDVVADYIRRVPVQRYVARYEELLKNRLRPDGRTTAKKGKEPKGKAPGGKRKTAVKR